MQPPGRFGAIQTNGDLVAAFAEKAEGEGSLINGGFFVLEPNVLDFIDDDMTAWEGSPITKLISEMQLVSYKHQGFWRPMDTLRDKNALEKAWTSGNAPWKIWK